MSTNVRFTLGAAAVLIVGVVAVRLLPSWPTDAIGGLASPSPIVSPDPTATAKPSVGSSPSVSASAPLPKAYAWPNALEPGTYATSFVWDRGLQFRFTVPDGWQSRDIEIIKGDRMAVQFYLVDNVPIDVCSDTPRTPAIGGTVDDLVTALSKLVSYDAAATSVDFAGQGGKYLEFTIGSGLNCAPSGFHLVSMPAPTCAAGCGGLGDWPWKGIDFGVTPEHHRLWILGIGRGRVVIDALWTQQATPADLAELQTVIDSIKIATPGATPPPRPQSQSSAP